MATTTSGKGKGMGPRKKKLKEMNIDEFMSTEFDSDSETSSKSNGSADGKAVGSTTMGKSKKKENLSTSNSKSQKVKLVETKSKGNKKTLANTLKDTDPDFYDYLQGEDKNLLNTLEDLSESDSGSELDGADQSAGTTSKKKKKTKFERDLMDLSSGEDDSDQDEDDSNLHVVPESLEVASDDSEADDEGEIEGKPKTTSGSILVTHKLIGKWLEQIKSCPSIKVLKHVVSAFSGAVHEAGGHAQDSVPSRYKIKGDALFNGVVRLCLAHVAPALQSILKVSSLSQLKDPLTTRNNQWGRIRNTVKSYLVDVLRLLSQLSEAAMINTILKHVHKLTILYISFPRAAKLLLKQMIKMWSTGQETTRVLAFLIINKLIQLDKDTYLEVTIKKLYMAYVSNCKFVSPNTLPLINFMQHSLVEIFTNDESLSYQYAFVYIRQLAIHLRNAMTVTKKNTCQAVYNWQYIHCLGLWVHLLGSFPSEALKPLIYPLTQTIIGTIKLLPTSRYYPLRFHCVRFLNSLSLKTKTYIPTLPFLLEILEQLDFNKRHKSVSLKPFNFAVILKFSKPQLLEKAFKDGLIDQLYEHLMESYNIHAHSVGFPELVIPSVLHLKEFIKKCKIANYCKQLKQIVEKMEEQSKFIVQKRKQATLKLDDLQGLQRWEEQIESSPLRNFYTSWRKLRDRELMHAIANKEAVSGAAFEMPVINRKAAHKATAEERQDLAKLFEEFSDSDSDDETRFLLKGERPKTESKKRKREDGDSDASDDDNFSDFDDDELEQLAKSASEDEEDDSEMDYDSGSVSESESEEDVKVKNKKGIPEKNSKAINKKSEAKTGSKDNAETSDEEEDDVVEEFVLSDSD